MDVNTNTFNKPVYMKESQSIFRIGVWHLFLRVLSCWYGLDWLPGFNKAHIAAIVLSELNDPNPYAICFPRSLACFIVTDRSGSILR